MNTNTQFTDHKIITTLAQMEEVVFVPNSELHMKIGASFDLDNTSLISLSRLPNRIINAVRTTISQFTHGRIGDVGRIFEVSTDEDMEGVSDKIAAALPAEDGIYFFNRVLTNYDEYKMTLAAMRHPNKPSVALYVVEYSSTNDTPKKYALAQIESKNIRVIHDDAADTLLSKIERDVYDAFNAFRIDGGAPANTVYKCMVDLTRHARERCMSHPIVDERTTVTLNLGSPSSLADRFAETQGDLEVPAFEGKGEDPIQAHQSAMNERARNLEKDTHQQTVSDGVVQADTSTPDSVIFDLKMTYVPTVYKVMETTADAMCKEVSEFSQLNLEMNATAISALVGHEAVMLFHRENMAIVLRSGGPYPTAAYYSNIAQTYHEHAMKMTKAYRLYMEICHSYL